MSDARYRAPSREARFWTHAEDVVRETIPAWPEGEAGERATAHAEFRRVTESPGAILYIEQGGYIMVTRVYAGDIPQIGFITNDGWGWREDRPERMERHDYRMWLPGETRVVCHGCNLPPTFPDPAE